MKFQYPGVNRRRKLKAPAYWTPEKYSLTEHCYRPRVFR